VWSIKTVFLITFILLRPLKDDVISFFVNIFLKYNLLDCSINYLLKPTIIFLFAFFVFQRYLFAYISLLIISPLFCKMNIFAKYSCAHPSRFREWLNANQKYTSWSTRMCLKKFPSVLSFFKLTFFSALSIKNLSSSFVFCECGCLSPVHCLMMNVGQVFLRYHPGCMVSHLYITPILQGMFSDVQ
jgi:hypothetical protein